MSGLWLCPLLFEAQRSHLEKTFWSSMHIAKVSLNSYIHKTYCVWKAWFHGVFIPFLFLNSSNPAEIRVLLGNIWWRHPLIAVSPKDSHSLHIVLLWASVFVAIFYMMLLWKWLRNAQNYKYNRRPLRLILCNHI